MAMLLGATIAWALTGLLFFLAFQALGLRFVPSQATQTHPFPQASAGPSELTETVGLEPRSYR